MAFCTQGADSFVPAVGANGTVYFGSNDRYVYAIGGDLPPSWPSFRHDSKHTGKSSINVSDATGASKWKFDAAELVTSSPATSGELTIYVGSLDNATVKWRTVTGDAVESSPAIGTDGTIYIGADSYLYALN
jgi:outer membrane protein assembly factor BamB